MATCLILFLSNLPKASLTVLVQDETRAPGSLPAGSGVEPVCIECQ